MKPKQPYIAIVDDDPDDREFLASGLQRCFPEHTVLAFEKGTELLDFLNNCAPDDYPNGIILDYKMPDMTGADLLEVIGNHSYFSRIPKVICSTSPLQKEIDHCLALGAARWIVKPPTDGDLDHIIRSLRPLFFLGYEIRGWFASHNTQGC